MKLKVVILTQDQKYAERFLEAVMLRFAESMEVSVFSRTDRAVAKALQSRSDIFLSDIGMISDDVQLPKYCSLVYFVDKKEIAVIDNHRAIMKYQSLDAIYKCLLDVYADQIGSDNIGVYSGSQESRIITFFSGAGGVGASTMAAACAEYIAKEKKESVIYLNLEQTGAADQYFKADGNQDFSKVLYALSIYNNGSRMKMESALKQDQSGVYFYSCSSSALDMLELYEDMIDNLFHALNEMKLFQWIVVDMDFSLTEQVYRQIERSVKTVMVSDGSQQANYKLTRKLKALELISEQREAFPINRIFLLYNRFSSKNGERLENTAFKTAGGVNRIEADSQTELIQMLVSSKGTVYENLLDLKGSNQ